MKGFNTDRKSLIKDLTGVTEQDKILKSLFVTNADEAMDEFEKEKENEIETNLGNKIAKPNIQ